MLRDSSQKPVILGIESSCDDTGASIIEGGKILANLRGNQSIHEQFGGVVPEFASREHEKHIVPLVSECLRQSKKTCSDLDAIAVTRGPGLIGSLLVGTSFAKGLGRALSKPVIGIHHMKAHILAHFIDDPKPKFPFLCLTISGGHTQLVLVEDHLEMKILGSTIDDAAGEAFDKIGKTLGLSYPAGPEIDQRAKLGDAGKFSFVKPKVADWDFSFSGLKTHVLYFLRDRAKADPDFLQNNLNHICASLQRTIVEILLDKLERAAVNLGVRQVAIAGGVSANSEVRDRLEALAKKQNWEAFIPQFQYCTDNAAMIAMAGHYHFLSATFEEDFETAARIDF